MFGTSQGRAEMLPTLTASGGTGGQPERLPRCGSHVPRELGDMPHRSHVSGGRLDVSARAGVLLAAHANGSSYQPNLLPGLSVTPWALLARWVWPAPMWPVIWSSVVCTPAIRTPLLRLLADDLRLRRPMAGEVTDILASVGWRALTPI